MKLATVVAIAMFVGITLYALLAGADFGGGFWDLFAGDAEHVVLGELFGADELRHALVFDVATFPESRDRQATTLLGLEADAAKWAPSDWAVRAAVDRPLAGRPV